jgi:hypothetical protein
MSNARSNAREAARAAFILDEALKLDIRVGAAHDGSELTIVPPRGMPHAVYCTFRDAILGMQEAVVDYILRENGVRR